MARPKGARNKVSGAAKENIAAVFVRLGGTRAMADWAEENQTEFYKLYSRLIPVEMRGPGDNGEHKMEVTWQSEPSDG